jgi:hypothetical protein
MIRTAKLRPIHGINSARQNTRQGARDNESSIATHTVKDWTKRPVVNQEVMPKNPCSVIVSAFSLEP